MAWIESHQSLGTHRKLLRLRRCLDIKDIEAVGLLHFLWWWSLDNAPDGELTGLTPSEIAEAAHWKGSPERFLEALITAKFVDEKENEGDEKGRSLLLHGWDDYAGKLIDRRSENAKRQKDHRMKLKSNTVTVTSQLRNAHVTVTSQLRNGATGPNPTEPNNKENILKEKSTKKKYGEFQNVFLSDHEYQKLTVTFNSQLPDLIERLSQGIASKGYKYKSHYATILNWARRDEKNGGSRNGVHQQGTNSNKRGKVITDPSQFTRPEDY